MWPSVWIHRRGDHALAAFLPPRSAAGPPRLSSLSLSLSFHLSTYATALPCIYTAASGTETPQQHLRPDHRESLAVAAVYVAIAGFGAVARTLQCRGKGPVENSFSCKWWLSYHGPGPGPPAPPGRRAGLPASHPSSSIQPFRQ